MRHSIARAISACLHILLSYLLPATGTRRKPLAAAAPVPPETSQPYVSPWTRPWTSPSKEEAAAIFRRQAEADATRERLQQERRRAAAYATLGIDYPYTYDGAPFGPAAFTDAGPGPTHGQRLSA
ncbi:hypothetical protein IAG44_17770 [Streptomyces roseirectus]|uniref:Uncharacterized protein n=1 Tax=Streptomyces roseirectus TaxID=2768066 RepID=A0A7H0IE87_9ACTN|nr:hypothetical protein [Streptomyces roseirectus]QNP71103.1 hypothetical protein IAG44_17770 [Streptomyces roseirectus]